MRGNHTIEFDEIGVWSELKLQILREYAVEYSKILSSQKQSKFYHHYIDGFAGAGVHRSRETGELVSGSPTNALNVTPGFREYHFVELEPGKAKHLREKVGDRRDVHIYQGDCNRILLDEVFPQIPYKDYHRALCLLDPYGLHLDWKVMERAGKMRSIEIFLNFPIMDMNRNAIWRHPERVSPEGIERMNSFWGDKSWQDVAYTEELTLFGEQVHKLNNKAIVEGFRERLMKVAGFEYVPNPIPMKNSINATVYYLFFGSHSKAGNKIATHLFENYRR